MKVTQAVLSNAALSADQLAFVFHETFEARYQTRIAGGGQEPIYRPIGPDQSHHLIVYTRDYGASALHEIAHWCVAGAQRREQEDYGYWYAPDGRSAEQQAVFERVEVVPQAFEWMFSVASGRAFKVSADNLEAGVGASDAFKASIYRQVQCYCEQGLPERAGQYAAALAQFCGVADPLNGKYYRLEQL